MAWECAECHAREGAGQVFIDAVCHHCGKPLCRHDRVRIVDEAFAESDRHSAQLALHCKECKQRHHPRAVALGGAQ
ncbi:hypothetical protein ACQPZF_27730 [Actinosynnema sp. CS-041913]|uniref:hypothetical protein n=1 Tax=Actinosynnema sp. CS-041913 TaxID=3239917 RepID=UPI003D91DEC2